MFVVKLTSCKSVPHEMEKECSKNKLVQSHPIIDGFRKSEKMIKGNYSNVSAGKNNTPLLNPSH